MDSIFNEVCVSVTAAFALTVVSGLGKPERSLLSGRDQGTALLVLTILAFIEEATVSHAGLINERIVMVCAAGLVAGPWVGLAVRPNHNVGTLRDLSGELRTSENA